METGYHVQCVLNHFTHDYNTNNSLWEVQCVFTELVSENLKQQHLWEKNRKNVYSVSITNFIRSYYQNTLSENGFMLLGVRMKETITLKRLSSISEQKIIEFEPDQINAVYPDDFLFTDSANHKTVNIPEASDIMLFCFGKPITDKEIQEITAAKKYKTGWKKIGLFRNVIDTPQQIDIFPDGTYTNRLILNPMLSSKSLNGLNMFLPVEYSFEVDSVAVDTFAKNKPHEDVMPIHLTAPLLDVSDRFDLQLSVFPQEKVYLHTDKPYYISGERIWFRAHVVDAATHVPSFSSGSVFAELFDARDSVVCRVKTGIANDLFSGYINIPEDAPEGDYTLRAWTNRMRNLDEDCFFLKNIRIGEPMSRMVQAQPQFEFLTDRRIGGAIRFSRLFPSASINPESVKVAINNQNPVNLKSVDGLSSFSFNLPSAEKQRVMLLEATYEKYPFRQYIKIPLPDDDFDVSFYPEGGSALYGVEGRMVFRAMQRDGTETNVEGIIYNTQGQEITQFKTDARGMGQFRMRYDAGETYYAVCTSHNGQSKRFDLPEAKKTGYALSASWVRDRLIVNVLQPESQKTDTLCLIVHTRGVVQDVSIWENTGEPVIFQKDFFPSGVSHLLLLTKEMAPVSERLVFVNNDDQAKVECTTDREAYPAGSPVEYTVSITDKAGEPLHGNFSVSVTDDHDVLADTTANILTSLLLSSDLRGALPDPAYFFRKNNRSSDYALDMLMLTQGWRRYDTERIVRNDLMQPDSILEKGYELSGMVRTSFLRPSANKRVSLLSMNGDYSAETFTDRNGQFYFQEGVISDSVFYLVQTEQSSGIQNFELILDEPSYPERTITVSVTAAPDREQFAKYADKVEQQYVDEHGTRIIHIEEVTITAQAPKRKIADYSFFYKAGEITYCITEEDINKFPAGTVRSLLMRIPGISVSGVGDDVTVTHGKDSVVFRVNDFPESAEKVVESLNISDIAQVDYLTGSVAAIFTNGDPRSFVISIYTKRGKNIPKETPYIKYFMPLGIQKPAEFYAPKYDTPARNTKPDLRTTIHWQPNITTDEDGKASFSFYTADAPSTYTVVIEGITEDGEIVYRKDKIKVTDHNHP